MAMLVKDLIAALQGLPPDTEVILQRDSEGNGYSPLAAVDANCVYVADTTWHGEVYDLDLMADEHDLEWDEWERLKRKPRCVVLAPVN